MHEDEEQQQEKSEDDEGELELELPETNDEPWAKTSSGDADDV